MIQSSHGYIHLRLKLTGRLDKLVYQPAPASIDPQKYQMYSTSNSGQQSAAYSSSEEPALLSLGLIEDMLDTPGQMDWVSTFYLSNTLPYFQIQLTFGF